MKTVLPGEESVSAGRDSEIQGGRRSEVDVNCDSENGALPESAPAGQVGPFGQIYTQFKVKRKKQLLFCLRKKLRSIRCISMNYVG